MTERSESERAELVALEAELRRATYGKVGPTSPKILGLMVAAADAIHRLAAQDQKPVAFLHETEWGDKSLSFEPAKNHLQWKDTPLYIAPPTAAGWDQAIEAAALTARGFNAAANSSAMRRFVNADLIKEVYERDGAIADAIEALSKPASGDADASEFGTVRGSLDKLGRRVAPVVMPESLKDTIATCYGLLWHVETDSKYIHRARRGLLQWITKDEQGRGIENARAIAIANHIPLPDGGGEQ